MSIALNLYEVRSGLGRPSLLLITHVHEVEHSSSEVSGSAGVARRLGALAVSSLRSSISGKTSSTGESVSLKGENIISLCGKTYEASSASSSSSSSTWLTGNEECCLDVSVTKLNGKQRTPLSEQIRLYTSETYDRSSRSVRLLAESLTVQLTVLINSAVIIFERCIRRDNLKRAS